ncbi:MAG: type II toxin-antitoxin system VapC family toxin [Deltaproteobacteria bacterium]|nr:type II toxin-antitoxin system VapC family toxin [Deltaproteobacteria bacterium]
MSYLLDTDICIYLLNGGNEKLAKKFRENSREVLAISTITEAELYFGALHSLKPQNNLERVKHFIDPLEIAPFDSEAALHFAEIKQALSKKGTPIGVMDMLIAAVARSKQMTVVTNNLKHFKNVPQLWVENWS